MAANEAQLNGKVISNRYQFRDGVEEGKLFENGNGGACERGIQELDFVSFLPEAVGVSLSVAGAKRFWNRSLKGFANTFGPPFIQ
jgi:hypothetical protein